MIFSNNTECQSGLSQKKPVQVMQSNCTQNSVSLNDVAHHCIQSSSEYFQKWKFHGLSRFLIPLLHSQVISFFRPGNPSLTSSPSVCSLLIHANLLYDFPHVRMYCFCALRRLSLETAVLGTFATLPWECMNKLKSPHQKGV